MYCCCIEFDACKQRAPRAFVVVGSGWSGRGDGGGGGGGGRGGHGGGDGALTRFHIRNRLSADTDAKYEPVESNVEELIVLPALLAITPRAGDRQRRVRKEIGCMIAISSQREDELSSPLIFRVSRGCASK